MVYHASVCVHVSSQLVLEQWSCVLVMSRLATHPICPTSFDYDCYNSSLTVEKIQEMIWKEAITMNSERQN